jgi:hypothetical protein
MCEKIRVAVKATNEVGKGNSERAGNRRWEFCSEGTLAAVGRVLKEKFFVGCELRLELTHNENHVYGSQWTHDRSYVLFVGDESVLFFWGTDWRVKPSPSDVEEDGSSVKFADGTIIKCPGKWDYKNCPGWEHIDPSKR